MELHLTFPLKTFHHSFAGIVQIAFLEDRFETLMLMQNHILLLVNLQYSMQDKEKFLQVLNQFVLST